MITEKAIHELVVDPEFKNLIRPLFKQEYLQLEQNLISDGCRDPLTTWHGIIIDGHNRYELCRKHQIPFSVEEMEFECKEEVIAWDLCKSTWPEESHRGNTEVLDWYAI